VNATASTDVKLVASVGVRVALRTVAPLFAGTHEHLATNGVTVVVATASQPVITTPTALNLTAPAVLAVATIIAGLSPKTVLPPESTSVGVVAADAGVPPTTAPPTSAMAPIATLEMNLFIYLLLLLLVYTCISQV
jgi:hypothetical protein